MKKQKRFLALALASSMMMSMLCVTASAEGTETEDSVFGCGNTQGQLLCEVAEHTHDDDECYEYPCTCGYEEKVCDIEEHGHGDTCFELNCSKDNTTLECAISEHAHGDGCYTYVEHVHEGCPEDCAQEGTTSLTCDTAEHGHTAGCYHAHAADCFNLICTTDEHDHTDSCNHAHVDACYTKTLKCETAVHTHEDNCYHAHDRDCLTDEALADVLAVEELLNAAPTLEKMHAERNGTYKDTKNYPADQAASDYDAYIAESFAAREAAQDAYDELPAELQKLVASDLLNNLDSIETSFDADWAKNVTKGENGYMFQSVYEPGYEKSHHVFKAEGKKNQIPELLILVDASENYTWTPDGRYSSGESNYEVVYCCDMETLIEDGVHYKRMNLEESEYYEDTDAERIRGIVTNSYPYVSLEEMKQVLEGKVVDAANLTRGDVISAVQFAIWGCANSAHVDGYSYTTTFDITNYNKDWGRALHDYANEMYEWWNVGKGTYYTNEAARARIASLAEYLYNSNLNGDKADEKQIVITSVDIIGNPVPVLGNDGMYEVALKVKLNSSGSGNQDNLALTATAGSGEGVTVDVVYGQTEYMMLVTAAPNDEIVVEISGTQFVPEGVYFYAPEAADTENDEDEMATAREVSQNLVGVAMGDTPVYAMKSVPFEMEVPEIPVSASLNLLKVNETGKALADAEFTLATDIDGDEELDAFATYITNDEGKATIDGLIPGVEYVLTETKAPAGYDPITRAIEFTVEQEEDLSLDMVFNLPNGVTCDTPEDEQYVLTVVNCKTWVDDGDDDDDDDDDVPIIIIPEDPVPLEPAPELPELEELPEEEVPLAPAPELEELPEEDIPLADVPKTGDATAMWLALNALSGTALAGVSILGRKKREDEEI